MFHFLGSASPTAWTNGIVLVVLVYYTAKISAAHLNPAVSLTFCILGHVSPWEMLCYWTAQVSGCGIGALLLAGLIPGLHVRETPSKRMTRSGCFYPASSLTDFGIFAWEAVCTTTFIAPIFSVVWYTQRKRGYGNTGPLIVGLSLLGNALAAGPFTGASLNPARSVASPMVFDCTSTPKMYLYVLGELAGGLAASLLVIPWYGISGSAWYGNRLPRWAFQIAKRNQESIVLETIVDSQHQDQQRHQESSRPASRRHRSSKEEERGHDEEVDLEACLGQPEP